MHPLLVAILALLPAILITFLAVKFLFKKSQLPAQKVLIAFVLGVIIGLPVYYFEQYIGGMDGLDMSRFWHALGVAFAVIAIPEEIGKYLGLNLSQKLNPIDEFLDLIVLSLAVAMGFAGLENMLYGHDHGWEVALFRSITAIPAHAIFALAMVYFLQPNRFEKLTTISKWIAGISLAVLLHTIYDFFIIQEISEQLMLGAIAFLLIAGIGLGLWLRQALAGNSGHTTV